MKLSQTGPYLTPPGSAQKMLFGVPIFYLSYELFVSAITNYEFLTTPSTSVADVTV